MTQHNTPTCKTCGKPHPKLTLEPTPSQLIIGGFPIKLEYRCPHCEQKLATKIQKLLQQHT